MADPTADLRQQLADHEADKDKRDTKMFVCLALENCRQTIVFICDPSFVASSLCMRTYIETYSNSYTLFSDLCCDDGLFAVDVECNNLIAMLLGLAFSRSHRCCMLLAVPCIALDHCSCLSGFCLQ